jgi:hypothetical protein
VHCDDFSRYDIVSLTRDRAELRAGTQGQVLGCYRRLRETSWVVAFDDRVVEDLHHDELAFVRAEPARITRAARRFVVVPRLH